jgi:signal transduction histidine kinase
MFKLLFPGFEDKNIQIKHNTLISYALFLFVQSVFTGYSTFNIGSDKSVFIISTLVSIVIPCLVIIFARRNYSLVSKLFIGAIWTSSSLLLLLFQGDNSVVAFLMANLFIISALASLSIRWYAGIICGAGSVSVAITDFVFEKHGILNIFHLEPIPGWIYFMGFSIMLGTMLINAMANALSFENISLAYNAELNKRIKAESLLINQNVVLDEKVRERTNEIKSLNEELSSANKNLFQINKEQSVTNEELISTNEELICQREELEATLTKLQIAQEQLVQSEKMASLGVLAAGVAHEINNPLNFIKGGILGIENYFKDDLSDHTERVSPLIEAINIGVDRAAGIVKSLNRFSRQTESTTEKCDIHSIINNCLVILNNETINRIEICKKFTDSPFSFYGNEGKLHQAIMNILTNSIQAINEKGSITISTFIREERILLTFQDSGHGIKKEVINRIFDPFFTTKGPGKGPGLGLSISYQLIQEFKGSIEVQSETGKGTNVILSLPLEKQLKL